MYKLPLIFPKERKKRGYFEKYKDMLSALYFFHNLSLYQLVGICNLSHHTLKDLIKFAKEREQLEEEIKGRVYLYNLTEEGLNCLSCWKSLEKNFDLVDLVPSVLPNFEIELKYKGCFFGEPKPWEFSRRKVGISLYLSFLNCIQESAKPLGIAEIMFQGKLSYNEVATFKKAGISKDHIKVEKGKFMLTEKGSELLELFSRYVSRFNLQALF